MTAEILLANERKALANLCRAYHVLRLELFGSATDASFDPQTSDLDFLVSFEPCTPSEHYERYFGLLESLEALLTRPVDLIEAQAMRNPYFVRAVNASKRLLYAA